MLFDFSFELKKGHLFRVGVCSNNLVIAMQPLSKINLILPYTSKICDVLSHGEV